MRSPLPPGHGRSLLRAVVLVLVVAAVLWTVEWWRDRVPDDASPAAFCEFWSEGDFVSPDAEAFSVEAFAEMAERIREMGSPRDASAAVRRGVLLRVEWAETIAAGDLAEAEELIDEPEERADWTAMETYLAESCVPG